LTQKGRLISFALLLHDIGKIKISDDILNKTSSLTSEEYAEMKLHTHFGYEIIHSISGMTEEHALVALQHHEREDGSGYPFGITGNDITSYSKIVAVADVFHTMISERVYKKPTPLYQVLKELDRCAYGSLHPKVVHTFILGIMNKMIGESIILSMVK
jgi:HD-GYP domain-containing protein (c-di-GMP phosphodiesterase class II)